jgi:hypothetical protein
MKYILTLPRLRDFISLSMGLAIAGLLSILAPSAMAHCEDGGKHTGNHPHCASDGGSGGSEDTTPPAAITDLTIASTMFGITLEFTATGDDGLDGEATAYDVRYQYGQPCTESPENWTLADRVRVGNEEEGAVVTRPALPGIRDWFNVRPLEPDTVYCIAISVVDEAGNRAPYMVVEDVGTLPAEGWTIETIGEDRPVRTDNVVFAGDSDSGSGFSAIAWKNNEDVWFLNNGNTFAFWDSQFPDQVDEDLSHCDPDLPSDLPCFDTADLSLAQDATLSGLFSISMRGRYAALTGKGKKTEGRDAVVVGLRQSATEWEYRLARESFTNSSSNVAFFDEVPAIVIADASGTDFLTWDWNSVDGFTSKQVLACETSPHVLTTSQLPVGIAASFIASGNGFFILAELDANDGEWTFRRGGQGWPGQLSYIGKDPIIAGVLYNNQDDQQSVVLWDERHLTGVTAELACGGDPAPPSALAPTIVFTTGEYPQVVGLHVKNGSDINGSDSDIYVVSTVAEGNLNWVEPRLSYSCDGGSSWTLEQLDRTAGDASFQKVNQPMLSPDQLIWAYNRGVMSQKTGPGRHPQYVEIPQDSIILATRSSLPCVNPSP